MRGGWRLLSGRGGYRTPAHGPIGENVPNPVTGTLADPETTVSHHLRLKALAVTLYGKGSWSPYKAETQVGIDPDPWWLPDVEAGVVQTQGGGQKAISMGYGDFLRLTKGERSGREGEITFDQVTGGIGPFSAYYEKGKGGGPLGSKTETYGAKLDFPLWGKGRALVEGERQKTINPWVEARGHRGRVGGEYPFGPGKLHGGVEHRRMNLDVSGQNVSVAPETSAHMGWTGKLGPVHFGLSGQYEIPSDLWKVGVFGRVKF